jgi:hypothetical protein
MPAPLTESDISVGWVQNVAYYLASRLTGLSFVVGTTVKGSGKTIPTFVPRNHCQAVARHERSVAGLLMWTTGYSGQISR